LAHFAVDGCLKIKMSSKAAEFVTWLCALGRKNYFLLVPTPESECGDHRQAHRNRQTPMSNSTQ
jgi:hypothetical protein